MLDARALAVYGSGGFAREVAWLAESCWRSNRPTEVVAFIDDDPDKIGSVVNEIPVLALDDVARRWPGASFVAAVGSPAARRTVAERAQGAGLRALTLIDESVRTSKWVRIGEGTVVCAGCILTCNIDVGVHVQVNLDCTVGHDVVLGDYATLAPGVHVSGCVEIQRGAYVGTGAVIINGTPAKRLVVGEGAVVGAGACVVKDVPPGVTVVGVPAKAMQR